MTSAALSGNGSPRGNAPPAEALRWAAGLPGAAVPLSPVTPLDPDGSERRLYRLGAPPESFVLAVNPLPPSPGPNENDSFVYLAGHLGERGLPVPAVRGYLREEGWYIMDDLGDDDLFGALAAAGPAGCRGRYLEIIELLLKMQVEGTAGFDPGRCHSPPRYNRTLMRAGESGYFQRELLERHFAMAPLPGGLEGEFELLARRAARAGAGFFIHRDFQSRNLKLTPRGPAIIDFQGGRWGPPQYDLAALLLDPYADLPRGMRDELTAAYLAGYRRRAGGDGDAFMEAFPYVAAHRLMQALGAFAYLGGPRRKRSFLEFIPAGLRLLHETQRLLPPGDFPALETVIAAARERAGERWTP